MQTLQSLITFFVKTVVKFRILQASKILNNNRNKSFPIPFKVMCTFFRCKKQGLKNNCAVIRHGYLYGVNRRYSLTNAIIFLLK